MTARRHLSKEFEPTAQAFDIYLTHLLETIVSKGDSHDVAPRNVADTELAAQEIAQLLSPLAILLSKTRSNGDEWKKSNAVVDLERDAWFNIVVHGFTLTSALGKEHVEHLQSLAQSSQPLIAEERADQVESDVELNTVLRRGKSLEHTIEQKSHLLKVLPLCEADIKSLSYSEVVFVNTAYLVENLRAASGDCTKALAYFLDPKLRHGAMGNCMSAIATSAARAYVAKTLTGKRHAFSTPYLARQLATMFAACCHRIGRVQQVATATADLIIRDVPSTLCQKTALFALLELLSIMWSSCLEGETDEYSWTSTFSSPRGGIDVELSDDFGFRRATLAEFHKRARHWVLQTLDVAPLDIKGLLQVGQSAFASVPHCNSSRHTC